MRLINVETFKLEEFLGDTIPPYAILSHTWGGDNEEVSFRNIEEGNFEKARIRPIKLEGCCKQAKQDGLLYTWIDTCCIDKANSVELSEAINSMFQWYKRASICYTYLSDVLPNENPRTPGSKFFSSRWFKRGWTLQELLASKKVHFYDSEWSYLGSKSEMSAVIEKITYIPRPFLLGIAEPHDASVAQRMSWAARRVTKRKEDIAYCLLGIFGVSMPLIYGEGSDQAFSRLQQEIMREIRDDSILAWGLSLSKSTSSNSTELISAGVLAAAPSDFANCGHIVSRGHYNTPFDIFGGSLRIHLPLFTNSIGILGLLKCGPTENIEQVVGIPLAIAMTKGESDEYIRPHGYPLVIIPKTTSEVLSEFIHIRKERKSKPPAANNRRYWFYIEESIETNLELIDVEPRSRWQRDSAMIMTIPESDSNIIQRTVTRFRHKKEGSCDFVVVLEFEAQTSRTHAQCHAMIASRDTSLKNVLQKFSYIRQGAFGKHSASNSILNLNVTLREEYVAGQPMFVVRLAAMPGSPAITVDATLELYQLDLKLNLVRILQEEDAICLDMKGLRQQLTEKTANLELMKDQLEEVKEQLKKLGEQEKLLVDGIEKTSQNIGQLTTKQSEIEKQQIEISGRRSHAQQHLDGTLDNSSDRKEAPDHEYETVVKLLIEKDIGFKSKGRFTQAPLLWAATRGHTAIAQLLLEEGANIETKGEKNQTPLLAAASNGHEAIAYLLLENGADIEAKDNINQTPLSWAAARGHKGVAQLLLERGANLEAKDVIGQRPLLWAAVRGHTPMVQLLLEKGANIDAKCMDGATPLLWAVVNGHEAVANLLLENGADIESKGKDDQTPLSWAALRGLMTVVQLLLEKGANTEAKDAKTLRTPLSWAALGGKDAVAQLLLENGADIEAKDTSGQTPLFLATSNGYQTVAQLLLEKGAKIEAEDNSGLTPLYVAASKGHKVVTQLLLEKGAFIEARDRYGRTPLMSTALNGYKTVSQLLLEKGANIEKKDIISMTPLLWATSKGHETVTQLLLEKGAKIEAKDNNGRTPLYLAVLKGHRGVAQLLLEKRAHIEAKDNYGQTPLSCATDAGHTTITKLLLEHKVAR